ncbi:MAG: ATP-binding protein [Ectobacillus sp.]
MLKELVLNTLIIMMPAFIFQLFRMERYNRRQLKSRLLLGGICGLASIACMAFPVVYGQSFLWDLRWIPFIVAVLYGGYQGGLVAGAFLLAFRAYLGLGLAFYVVIYSGIIVFVLLLLIRKTFLGLDYFRKIMAGIAISLVVYTIVMFFIWFYFKSTDNLAFFFKEGPLFFVSAAVCYTIALACNIVLFERIYEQAKMQDQFSKAEKLNIVSELAASIAHEVRNPLTVVRGFIQLTQEHVDADHRYFMETAIRELDRAETIITDYLNFAKPKCINKEIINISQELKILKDLIQSYANLKGVILNADIQEDLYMLGDRLQFKQIILNLVKNSIEATENKGFVVIRAFSSKGFVYVQVIDTGEGMSEEQLQNLGNPYYSTKEKGTGLGLMVTFRLVEEFGGNLHFESELGKGTTAALAFPKAK